MISIFLICTIFCIYTYLLYPLIIELIVRWKNDIQIDVDKVTDWPNVSIIVAVHNEEKYIERKLQNIRQLAYPGVLELVVVSDGSTDKTNAIIESQDDVAAYSYQPARGKPSALNLGVSKAKGEIVVFMDARQTVSLTCVHELVKYFQCSDTGAVSGELIMINAHSDEAENIGLYWKYEKWIRANESQIFSTAGATGALYATRKEYFHELAPDTLLDDFETPINSLKVGKRTLFEPKAIAYDTPSSSGKDEFKRKARTLAGNYQSFVRNKWLFSPFRNRIFLQFLSHKVFRLFVPYAMLGALISSALSSDSILRVFFILQIVFYLLGIGALISGKVSNFKACNFIKIFLQMNYAAVVGLYNFLLKNSSVRWKSV